MLCRKTIDRVTKGMDYWNLKVGAGERRITAMRNHI